jgi:hypothetical protein
MRGELSSIIADLVSGMIGRSLNRKAGMDAGMELRCDGFSVVQMLLDDGRHIVGGEAAIPHLIGNQASIGGHVALAEAVGGFDDNIIGQIGSLKRSEKGFTIESDAVDVLANEEGAG